MFVCVRARNTLVTYLTLPPGLECRTSPPPCSWCTSRRPRNSSSKCPISPCRLGLDHRQVQRTNRRRHEEQGQLSTPSQNHLIHKNVQRGFISSVYICTGTCRCLHVGSSCAFETETNDFWNPQASNLVESACILAWYWTFYSADDILTLLAPLIWKYCAGTFLIRKVKGSTYWSREYCGMLHIPDAQNATYEIKYFKFRRILP